MTGEMLVYCERREVLHELLSGGRALAGQLGLVLSAALLEEVDPAEAEACFRCGARRVYLARSPHLAGLDVERVAEALEQVAGASAAAVLLVGSTRRGKELAGRLAQKLRAGCVTDGTSLVVQDGQLVAQRCALGGKTVATERVKTPIKVFALKPRTFEPDGQDEAHGEMVEVQLALEAPRVKLVQRQPKRTEGVDLEQAQVVVAVGRGLQRKEDLPVVQQLADRLGGQLGCTRSLCADYGWLSEERMIGISGKMCKGRLHVSVGVSGQIQHAVGIQGSRIIVAINTDKSAPIFDLADYGIVGDLYEVVPKLVAQLKRRAAS